MGALYSIKVTSFEGTSAAITSPAVTFSPPAITLSGTTVNLSITASNPATFTSIAWVYTAMELMSPSKNTLLTQTTSCSGLSYALCRVYAVNKNIIVRNLASSSALSIPL